MNIRVRLSFLFLLAGLMSACSSLSVEDYADNKPALDVRKFFDGELVAHGIVKNRGGKLIRYFRADLNASWEAGVGTLDEQFVFDDGETQTRIWTLTPDAAGQYTASADDVIGESTMRVAGNSLFLDYILRVAYGDGSLDLRIDDRMYLISDRVMLNESIMSKWGIEVGRLTLVIEKTG